MNIRTTILLLIPGTLWGVTYLLNEIIIETIPPFSRGVLRNAAMLVPLVVILYLRGGRLKSTWIEWRPYTFIGLVDNAIPGVLIAWGQLYIDSGLTTILLALTPLFTVFLAHYFVNNDRLNGWKILGITLGLLGTLVLVGPSALLEVGTHLWGQLAVIGGAICYSITVIYIRVRFQHHDKPPIDSALETLTLQLIPATLLLIPFAWVVDQPLTLDPSAASIIALLASGWGASIVALILYYYLINAIGATVASTTLYLIPITGVILGAVILSEPVTWFMIVALALILSGVFLVNKTADHSEEKKPEWRFDSKY